MRCIKTPPLKVLMVMHTAGLTGPTKATLSLLRGMDRKACSVDVACPRDGDFVARLKNAGIRHIPLEFPGRMDWVTTLHLAVILKLGRYDIVHGHLGRTGPIVYIAGSICGIGKVLTEHMNEPDHIWLNGKRLRLRLHRLGHVFSNNLLDRVIAVSEETRRNYIIRQGMQPRKVVAINNSLYFDSVLPPEEKRAIKERLGIRQDSVVVGTAARLIAVKGIADFIAAAAIVVKQVPSAIFLIAGEGEERATLEAQAIQLGIRDSVIFLGFRSDLDNIFYCMDIVVHPSRAPMREAFGMVSLEAMAAGIPVIGSSSLSAGVVEDGVTGLIFEQRNPQSLAEKIMVLLSNPQKGRQLVERAREVIHARYSAYDAAAKTVEVYRDVLRTMGCALRETDLAHPCISCSASYFLRWRDTWGTLPFEAQRCVTCGLITLRFPQGQETRASDPWQFSVKAIDVPGKLFSGIREVFAILRRQKISRARVPGKVLDIGCGDGRFLRKMAEKGWVCCGIDQIDPARFEKSNPDIAYFHSEDFALDAIRDYFDVITFWHSLEHMPDPSSTLYRAGALLKDGGMIFICVPNGESIEARIQLRSWLGVQPGHHFIFTQDSLRRLLERNGFEVVAVTKNSLEYGPAFFVQCMMNFLGGENNFLIEFFRRNQLPDGFRLRRLYTVVLVSFLLPFLTVAGLLLYVFNSVVRNGPVLSVFCRKKGNV